MADPVVDPAVTPPVPEKPAEPPVVKTFSQEQVTEIASREKAEGRAAAERSLATELGVTVQEAKAILKAHKDSEDARKTEVDKALDAAKASQAEAEALKASAATEVHEARLERAFAAAGLSLGDKDEDKAKLTRIRRMVSVEAGASYEDVLKDVSAVKTEFPSLFEVGPPSPTKRVAPGGDPKGKPPVPNPGEDKFSAGAARAAQYGNGYRPPVQAPR